MKFCLEWMDSNYNRRIHPLYTNAGLFTYPGLNFEQIEHDFDGKGYGDFKSAVGEAVVAELSPIRKRYEELLGDKKYLEECYTESAAFATRISSRTVEKAMKKIGFVMPKR